jgi:uncharacterized protein YutE (UPF0331/DUF86 family)
MRNVLAHDYRGIDPEIVFDVVKNELPKLKSILILLLKEFSQNDVEVVLETNQYRHLRNLIYLN